DWTPNITDAQGRRYRFGWQPRVAQWNLSRLAQALSPLFGEAAPLQAGLDRYAEVFNATESGMQARKLGLAQWREGEDDELLTALRTLMVDGEVDMTLFFRSLASVDAKAPSLQGLEHAFYDPARLEATRAAFNDWLARYAARLRGDALAPERRREMMDDANPLYVPRNWLLQQAIDQAEQGDPTGVHELMEVFREPYREQPGRER